MVVAVFTFCLFLHFLVKRYNECRLEERFIRLYGKASASTQVHDTLLNGEEKVESSKNRKESKKSNAEGISMIFSKEANRSKNSHINDWIPGLSSLSFFRNKGIKLHTSDTMPKRSDLVVIEDHKLRSNGSTLTSCSLSKERSEETEIKSQLSDDSDNKSTYKTFLGAIYKNRVKNDKGEAARNNVIITDTKATTTLNSRQMMAYDLITEITGTVLDTVIDGKANPKNKKLNSKVTNTTRSKHSVKNDAISERFVDIDSQNNVSRDFVHRSESKEISNVKFEYLDGNRDSSRTCSQTYSDINSGDTKIELNEDCGSTCIELQKKIDELSQGIMHNLNSLHIVNMNLKEVVKMRQTAPSFTLIPSEIATLKFIHELVHGIVNDLQLKDEETKVTFVDEMVNTVSNSESNGIESIVRAKPSRIKICDRVPSAMRLKPSSNDSSNLRHCGSKVTFKDDIDSILTNSTLTFNDNINDSADSTQKKNS